MHLLINTPFPSNTSEIISGFMHTYLLRLLRRRTRLKLPQTLSYEQDPIYQQSVGRTLDLKIPEKCIGPEQREHFIEGVVGFAIGIDVNIGGGRRESGESIGWTAGTGAERKESKVPYFKRRFGVSLESEEVRAGFWREEGWGKRGMIPIRRTSVSWRKIE